MKMKSHLVASPSFRKHFLIHKNKQMLESPLALKLSSLTQGLRDTENDKASILDQIKALFFAHSQQQLTDTFVPKTVRGLFAEFRVVL